MSNSKDDALTEGELEGLWEAAREDELNRIIFVLAGELGLRANELAHVKRSWINFQRQEIIIPTQQGDWSPKTDNSARTVPYGPFRDRVSKEIRNFFDYHGEGGLARNSIWYRVKRIAEGADLTRSFYPHALRATCAFQLAEAKVNAQG